MERDGPGRPGPSTGGTPLRRAAVVVLLALAVAGTTPAARADDVVQVPGTSFPGGDTYLTWFGCAGLFGPAAAGPRSSVGLDADAPLGSRAIGMDLPGTGQATGPVTRVDRVAHADWSLWVRPVEGGVGAAHVWYVSAGLEPGEVWSGRADLTAATGQWQRVTPGTATYTWTRLVAAPAEVVEPLGTATIADFTAEHGDGPGYLLAGFGCDGAPFVLDSVTAGGTTYDLDGIPVATTIEASGSQAAPGAEVTLTGRTLDDVQRVTAAPLVLEERPAGAGEWAPVRAELLTAQPDGALVATVTPASTTDYRWYRPATEYADEGWSPVATVRVGP